jgi:uncharacterized protein (DUF697 family)
MLTYEEKITDEVMAWKRKITKPSRWFQRLAKKSQAKMNALIPEKVHVVITEGVKKIVQAVLTGAEFTTKKRDVGNLSLEAKDEMLQQALNTYKKMAAAEGAGTGAGGLLLGFADFPLLLTIKFKFLFEAASIYGFDVTDYHERLFILHVFQLAFSSDERRRYILDSMEHWDQRIKEIDWRTFQQEYRDYIDVAKLLQLVPGIGAIVGAYANYNLLDHLGETAMNTYRMRLLQKLPTA